MVTISGQYDIIDVVQLQRFVIEEFKQRHLEVKEMAKAKQLREEAKNADSSSDQKTEAATNWTASTNTYRGGKLNHNNMQSAQVN